MANFRHTPAGRGFESWLGYYGHCNDYWTEIDKCGMGSCGSGDPEAVVEVIKSTPFQRSAHALPIVCALSSPERWRVRSAVHTVFIACALLLSDGAALLSTPCQLHVHLSLAMAMARVLCCPHPVNCMCDPPERRRRRCAAVQMVDMWFQDEFGQVSRPASSLNNSQQCSQKNQMPSCQFEDDVFHTRVTNVPHQLREQIHSHFERVRRNTPKARRRLPRPPDRPRMPSRPATTQSPPRPSRSFPAV